MPRFARAEEPKTIALMFDAFDSDFWITGNTILKAKAEENGWKTLKLISNRDQNKQNDQAQSHGRAQGRRDYFHPDRQERGDPCDPYGEQRQHTHYFLQPAAGAQ